MSQRKKRNMVLVSAYYYLFLGIEDIIASFSLLSILFVDLLER